MSTPYKVKAGHTPCPFMAEQDVGWLCHEYGTIAFLVELPPEEILPVCKDNAEALLYLIEMAWSLRRRVAAPSSQGAINAVMGIIFLVLITGTLAVMLKRMRKRF